LTVVVNDSLDGALFLEMTDGDPCKRAIDTEALDQDGLRNETECWNFFKYAVVRRLVESNGVLGLIFDLALRPLLLLGGFSASGRRRRRLCFSL